MEIILQNYIKIIRIIEHLPSFYEVVTCKGTITFMKQYKTRKPNQNLAYIIFLQSKSQRHIAIKCQHSPSSSSRDKYAINISNSSHDSDKTLPMYSKGPLSSKTTTISSIFDDFLGFRAHLQVFECFCKFSSHDFTVPQISAAQITRPRVGTRDCGRVRLNTTFCAFFVFWDNFLSILKQNLLNHSF